MGEENRQITFFYWKDFLAKNCQLTNIFIFNILLPSLIALFWGIFRAFVNGSELCDKFRLPHLINLLLCFGSITIPSVVEPLQSDLAPKIVSK